MSDKRHKAFLTVIILAFLSLLVLAGARANGAELSSQVGTSHSVAGAIGLDARAAALAWAVTGVDMGAAGLEINPAAPALVAGNQFIIGHLQWVLDASVSQGIVAFPFRDEGVISLGLLHFDQGTVDEVLEDGSFTGETLGARDLQLSLGMARIFGDWFCAGAKLTLFQKTLGWERATGLMGSVGLLSRDLSGFRLGLAALDFGPPLRIRQEKDPAPLRFRVGASHQVRVAGDFSLQNSIDFAVPRDNYNSFGVGTEWGYRDVLVLRAGYRRTLMDDQTPESDRFHYGFGIRVGGYRLDYAFATKEEFENVHRVAVTYDFGRREAPAPAWEPVPAAPAPASETAAPADSAAPVPLAKVTVLQGIRFDLDSAEILPSSCERLDAIYDRLLATPDVEAVEIQGHTDDTGSEDYNLALSLMRARAVRDYFLAKGYPPRKLGVMGYGAERPLVANDSPEGRAQNRRIELHLVRVTNADL